MVSIYRLLDWIEADVRAWALTFLPRPRRPEREAPPRPGDIAMAPGGFKINRQAIAKMTLDTQREFDTHPIKVRSKLTPRNARCRNEQPSRTQQRLTIFAGAVTETERGHKDRYSQCGEVSEACGT